MKYQVSPSVAILSQRRTLRMGSPYSQYKVAQERVMRKLNRKKLL